MSEKDENDVAVFMSAAPTDPEEKKLWAKQMLRIQVAMWVDDGNKCAHCGEPYTSTDDMLERSPRKGYGKDMFVDESCWSEYMNKLLDKVIDLAQRQMVYCKKCGDGIPQQQLEDHLSWCMK